MKNRFDSSAPRRIGEDLGKIGEKEKKNVKFLTLSFNGFQLLIIMDAQF